MRIPHWLQRLSTVTTFCLIAGLSFIGCDSDDPTTGASAEVKVMTYNLYLGGDLFPLTAASSGKEVIQQATQLWRDIRDSRFDLRAAEIADLIENEAPDLIGLQEVSLYRTDAQSDFDLENPVVNASEVRFDFLALLMDELDARGLDYTVALEEENADVELPALEGTALIDVRLTDRDVILVRSGVTTSNPEVLTFGIQAAVEVPPGSGNGLEFTRSAQWVEATVDDVTFTFANAHLEVDDGNPAGAAGAQFAQALETVNGLSGAQTPVVLVGDFNSAADGSGTEIGITTPISFTGTTYGFLTQTYTDAAEVVGTTDNTCCQDGDLSNTASDLGSRIDLVLYRGSVTATAVSVVGNERTDLGGPQWPSDHAGVVATLTIEN